MPYLIRTARCGLTGLALAGVLGGWSAALGQDTSAPPVTTAAEAPAELPPLPLAAQPGSPTRSWSGRLDRPLRDDEAIRTQVTVIQEVTPPASKQSELPSQVTPTGGSATQEAKKKGEAPPPAPLINRLLGMEDSPVQIFGWIQNSFTGNPSQPANGMNFGVNPNNLANRWMGNQYYLVFENALEQNDQVNFGFRVDNLFGNDWQFNHMHGLFDTSFQKNHFAGYDPAQMYLSAHLPVLTKKGLDIKGGRFYSIAGYEGVPAISRPLLSVPYMFNYGQPFTFFGAVSTLHVHDRLKVFNGTINGWDRWIDRLYKWGYVGGFTWASPNQKLNVAFTFVWGPNQFPRFLPANTEIVPTGATPPPFLAGRRNPGYGGNDRSLFTTVVTYKWTDRFTQVIETDHAFEDNVPGLGPGGTNKNADWHSFGNWFLYQLTQTDKLTGVWRSEVFWDPTGIRTGFADTFYEMTLGAICKPVSWLWIRPEARYDWSQFTHPYNAGHSSSQFTIAVDAIVLF